MRLTTFLGLSILFVAIGLLSGCIFDKRKPVPHYSITVTADPSVYAFDGQPMGLDQLHAELKQMAEKNRVEATSNSRAYVKITSQPGAQWDRTVDLVDYCAGIGLDKIETVGR